MTIHINPYFRNREDAAESANLQVMLKSDAIVDLRAYETGTGNGTYARVYPVGYIFYYGNVAPYVVP